MFFLGSQLSIIHSCRHFYNIYGRMKKKLRLIHFSGKYKNLYLNNHVVLNVLNYTKKLQKQRFIFIKAKNFEKEQYN